MIVSQANYDRWQAMYSERKTESTAGSEDSNTLNRGNDVAVSTAKSGSENDLAKDRPQEKSFLETAFERVLFNRLGVDQEKMDELKEEIEKTEKAIETLNNQKPHSDAQQKQLEDLKDKLEKLEDALKELLRQANERANEETIIGPKSIEKSTGMYKAVSAFT